jgi:hypothetical protein
MAAVTRHAPESSTLELRGLQVLLHIGRADAHASTPADRSAVARRAADGAAT